MKRAVQNMYFQKMDDISKLHYCCQFCGSSGNGEMWKAVYGWGVHERMFYQCIWAAVLKQSREAKDITSQQILDINSAPAYSVACHETCDVNDIEQTVLLCRYVSSAGPKEEIIELIPLKGQTRGEDICEALINYLKAKDLNTSQMVSVSTDEAPSMRGAHKGFWHFTS